MPKTLPRRAANTHLASETSDSSAPLATFRARVATGSFDAVVGRPLRRALTQAADDRTLEPEIGALRLAMLRLLREEPDPTRLANGLARLAGVALQAARVRQSSDGGDSEIRAIFLREIAAIDAERDAALAAAADAAPRDAGWSAG